MKIGFLAVVYIEITPSNVSHGTVILSNLPKPFSGITYLSFVDVNGDTLPCVLERDPNTGTSGRVIAYYPIAESKNYGRIDWTFCYPVKSW